MCLAMTAADFNIVLSDQSHEPRRSQGAAAKYVVRQRPKQRPVDRDMLI
jgi:hypothetical protein